MKTLSEFETNFLNKAKSRVLLELDIFNHFDQLTYTHYEKLAPCDAKELISYKQKFILNSFVTLTGCLFFISNSVFDKDTDTLENEYIQFCKNFDKLYTI